MGPLIRLYTKLLVSTLVLAIIQKASAQFVEDVQEQLNPSHVDSSKLRANIKHEESVQDHHVFQTQVRNHILRVKRHLSRRTSRVPFGRQWPFVYMEWGNPDCPSNTEVLVWVHSRPSAYAFRQQIREMWANQRNFNRINLQVTVRFFMGDARNASSNAIIQYESKKYVDIVQENYFDSYRNLTYKAVSALRWVTYTCNITSRLVYIIKTDDDILVDVPNLHTYLQRVVKGVYPTPLAAEAKWFPTFPTQDWFVCPYNAKAPVIRDRRSKWYVSPGEHLSDSFPPHCHGFGIIMSPSVVSRLWSAVMLSRWLWVDDVYFTGVLVQQVHPPPVYFHSVGSFVREATRMKALTKRITLIHCGRHSHNQFSQMWMRVEARQVKERIYTDTISSMSQLTNRVGLPYA